MTTKCFGLLLLSLISVNAQEISDWIESSGECYLSNITHEEAIERAIKNAQLEAMKSFLGIKITEIVVSNKFETQNDYYELFSKLCKSTSSGRIVKSEILERGIDNPNDKNPKIVVKIRVKVAKDSDQPDPNFYVDINLEKNLFFDKNGLNSDIVKFKVKATKDCYLYIFNLMANDSLQLILPNQFIKDNQYLTSRPEQEYEKILKKMSFQVSVPQGKKSTVEALWVVALKQRYEIDPKLGDRFSTDKNISNNILGTIYDIQEWLLQIPFDQRTEGFISYEIVKKTN